LAALPGIIKILVMLFFVMVEQWARRRYWRLKEKCIEDFAERLESYEDYHVDEEDLEEIREMNECVLDFLDKYAKLSAGAMDDYEVEKFYKQTVEMLEDAIRTKKWQYEIAMERLDEIEEHFTEEMEIVCDADSEYYYPEACREVKEKIEEVKVVREKLKKAEKEDMFVMRARLKACRAAKTRAEKIICIDSVAGLVHARGSVLPLMCGVPLEEFIHEAFFGEISEEERGARAVAVDVAKEVMDVLTCIRNFREG